MKKKCLYVILSALLACCIAGCAGKDAGNAAGDLAGAALEQTEETGEAAGEDNSGEQQTDDAAADTLDDAGDGAESDAESGDVAFSFADVADYEFYFSSGAGAWGTQLTIQADGSFQGEYHDSDMGDMGDEYPNGTEYQCTFTGKFTAPQMADSYRCRFQIEEIHYEKEPDTEEILDGVRYIYSEPYGLTEAEDFYMYLPGTPFAEFSEEALSWIHVYDVNEEASDKVDSYVLYNEKPEYAFTGYQTQAGQEQTAYGSAQAILTAAQVRDDELTSELESGNLSQIEMNMTSKELFDTWDVALNQIWALLMEHLSEEAFSELKAEQRTWVEDKERAVEEEGAEYEGGSIQPLIMNDKAAELTKKRAYELAEMLK